MINKSSNYKKLTPSDISFENSYIPVLAEPNEYPVYIKTYLTSADNTIKSAEFVFNNISVDLYVPKISSDKINHIDFTNIEQLINNEINTRISAQNKLSSKINTVISNINNYYNLSLSYLDKDNFEKLKSENQLSIRNTIYLLSDINDMHDKRILNVVPATEDSDAINYNQLTDFKSKIDVLENNITSWIDKIQKLSVDI